MSFIPVYQPDLSGNEMQYVNDCLETNWISSKGKYIEKFEKNFSQYLNVKEAVSVCNGTVALHVALLALGIGDGDEVIVPTFTYVASVNSISYVGARPVFVDSLENTWQMDCDQIEKNISSKTKAILVVHLYGQPVDMQKILEVARKNDLKIIEDCAEAIGSEVNGRKVGTFGDVATFSFFGNKTITTGEGGMVISNNSEVARLSRHLKGQALVDGREYWHDMVGYNYRMTNICAAIGVAQLERVEKIIKRKIMLANQYETLLSSANLPVNMQGGQSNTKNTYWMCSIVTHKKEDRNPLREHLKQFGVETRPFFPPAHTLPMYSYEGAYFPIADSLSSRGLNLPSWPAIQDDQIKYICKTIEAYFRDHAK